MKHIFKKLHFGSSHDPGRSNEIPSPSSSSPSLPSPSPSPSCGSDHRAASGQIAGAQPLIPSPPSPSPADVARPPPADFQGYFSSEEEFQVQLALAISASNSEFREDPDNDQIRAATLLSLGRHNQAREEESAAESLSRRYWDYNVLDYDEKVADGFYDIFGLSTGSANQGKMPSLADLQTNIGDLGFEVIIVNRAIDPSLVELEQVAHCISLDCPVAEVGLLVQRISDLVMEHMGGPVRDANDMLARWMGRSTELRTSQQTSLLPIGCIKVGLSRHRALLFKVLADNVGIPCRLVKGSHYTGVDDDAVNIIKLDNDREFLVDLMAAPGTLLPADVLSTKDAHLSNPSLSKNLTSWAAYGSGDEPLRIEPLHGDYKGGDGNTSLEGNRVLDKRSRLEKAVLVPSFPSASSGALPTDSGSTSGENTRSLIPMDQSNPFSSSTTATSSKQKGIFEVPMDGGGLMDKELNMVAGAQDSVDSRSLFAELNPFLVVGVEKLSSQFMADDDKISEFQKRRENIASNPGRPPLPLVWKNRSVCNEVPNKKQYDFAEDLLPRKNVGVKDHNASSFSKSSSAIPGKMYSGGPNVNATASSEMPYSAAGGTSDNKMNDTSTGNVGSFPFGGNNFNVASRANQFGELAPSDGSARADKPLISSKLSGKKYQEENHRHRQNNKMYELREDGKNASDKHDRRKCTLDRFMGTNMILQDPESSTSPSQARPSRLDPMLDDVAECEIPWEDLVMGERIGLGSYGEVYHADWNGTEVAVKKFLDQDFSGDALDEFRSEVRIMRRLRHPNVVLFMGAVTRPPNLSIVTEFLPRGSLYRLVHRPNCHIDENRRIKMALDVAKGMNCLHSSTPTIVHRDLKSPNLLVDKNWNVKVCDFGLSRLKHNTFLSSKSTAGTPEWMAPEVLRNEPSNEKCDVYSFGVILWELTTLRMPWSGMNPMQVVGAVGFQNRRLDIPKEVDPLVARIIWECWQTDPNLRPSFAQLASALKPLQRLGISSHQDAQTPSVSQEISVNSTP